ncbi:MAG TPA: DUF6569 family protein [Methanobacterium sp.]
MDKVMEEYISNLDLGLVTEFKDMTVIPIFSQKTGPNYLTLKEAMEQDLLLITEIDEEGRVGELKVKNRADIPVLLLDGEEIVGAKQNRVLNTTILVGAGTEIKVPVSCTEQGRWSYKSRRFSDSNVIAARRVRRSKSASVKDSLRNTGNFRSNQREVWREIDEMSMDAKVSSSTRAMKDVYNSQETDLSRFIEAFPYKENQKGILVLINSEIAGLEVVSSEKAYKLLHEKLIRSYAVDVILSPDPEKQGKDVIQEAKEFVDRTKKSSESRHKSVGYGCDHRFDGEKLIGSSLIVEGKVIYSAFFNLN